MVGWVGCGKDGKCVHTFGQKHPKERDHLKDIDVDVRRILKWALNKSDVRLLTGFIWLLVWFSGSLEHLQ
jgi:hypothetical protein